MVNEFKLAVIHFATQTRCRPVHAHGFTAGQKTVEYQDWASGLLQVAGRWAFGPSGHCRPWATGVLLAKPVKSSKSMLIKTGYPNLLHACDFLCFSVMNY